MNKVMTTHAHTEDDAAKTYFGFWIYLMTDLLLFASLFATFAVMRNNTNNGPTGSELFSMPYVFVETLLLLTSSFMAGLALLAVQNHRKNVAILLLGLTFILGISFLGMEISEFRHLVIEGNSWRRSGFLSAFFTLVGTHGLHILAGLIWLAVLIVQIITKGISPITTKRATLFSMFWHFLDIIWIFIFTVVYLLGAVE